MTNFFNAIRSNYLSLKRLKALSSKAKWRCFHLVLFLFFVFIFSYALPNYFMFNEQIIPVTLDYPLILHKDDKDEVKIDLAIPFEGFLPIFKNEIEKKLENITQLEWYKIKISPFVKYQALIRNDLIFTIKISDMHGKEEYYQTPVSLTCLSKTNQEIIIPNEGDVSLTDSEPLYKITSALENYDTCNINIPKNSIPDKLELQRGDALTAKLQKNVDLKIKKSSYNYFAIILLSIPLTLALIKIIQQIFLFVYKEKGYWTENR